MPRFRLNPPEGNNRMGTIAAGTLLSSLSSSINSTLTILGENRSKIISFLILCAEVSILILFLVNFNLINSITPVRIDDNTGKAYFEKYDVSFGALYDVSQVKIEIPSNYCLISDYLSVELNSITDIVEFSSFTIQPDEVTNDGLCYRDSSKIDKIKRDGLTVFAKFPRFQGKQFIRITIITVLLSLVVAKLLKKLILLLKGLLRKASRWHKKFGEKIYTTNKNNEKKSTSNNINTNKKHKKMKKNRTIKVIIILLFALCIICGIISYILTGFWSNVLISLSVALLQLNLGIIIVNLYMVQIEKRMLLNTASQLLEGDSIRYYSNLTNTILEQLSVEEYLALRNSRNNGDTEFGDTANRYITAIRNKYPLLISDMDYCLQQLKVLISTGGINNEQDILFDSLGANRFFNELKNKDINNPDDYNTIILNLESFATLMLNILREISPNSIERYTKLFSQSTNKQN